MPQILIITKQSNLKESSECTRYKAIGLKKYLRIREILTKINWTNENPRGVRDTNERIE